MAPAGQSVNLSKTVAAPTGTAYTATDSTILVTGVETSAIGSTYVNNGTGSPGFYQELWGSGAQQYESPTGRLSVRRQGASAGAEELRFSTEGIAGAVFVSCPTYASGQTRRLNLRRAIHFVDAMPSSGTWEQGDIAVLNTPTIQTWSGGFAGLNGAKYTLLGWRRIVTGSAHVLNTDWVECRTLTGT